MNIPLSNRSSEITQSEIRAMTAACNEVNGINLAQGVCDLGVPPEVQAGVTRAMADGFNSYTPYAGLPALREAIAQKMISYNGIECDPDRNLILSAGSTGAFYSACLALLNASSSARRVDSSRAFPRPRDRVSQTRPSFSRLRSGMGAPTAIEKRVNGLATLEGPGPSNPHEPRVGVCPEPNCHTLA